MSDLNLDINSRPRFYEKKCVYIDKKTKIKCSEKFISKYPNRKYCNIHKYKQDYSRPKYDKFDMIGNIWS